jgi:hypothetical protein
MKAKMGHVKSSTAIMASLAAALFATTPARADNARQLSSAQRLRPDMGAIRVSIQSQVQLGGPLFVWFVREDGDPARNANLLRFERGQGVPVMGSNMVDSRMQVYAVRPGRYRLVAHSKSCSSLPPPDAICTAGGPTQRYEGETPVFEVRAGQLTEVGELILEAPAGTNIGEETGLRQMAANPYSFRIRVRASEQLLPPAFASLSPGPAPEVPPGFRSTIRCRARPGGAMMYLPFDC